MAASDLSADRARELFDYDPVTGVLTRKPCPGNHWQAVPVTKSHHPRGYLKAWVDKKIYSVHRLVWLIVHGKWPEHTIDHINHDPSDNRIENLRDVTVAVNNANRKRKRAKPRPSGKYRPRGSGSVFLNKACKSKPYRARICLDGKKINLGYFSTAEEGWAAIAAYQQSTGQLTANT